METSWCIWLSSAQLVYLPKHCKIQSYCWWGTCEGCCVSWSPCLRRTVLCFCSLWIQVVELLPTLLSSQLQQSCICVSQLLSSEVPSSLILRWQLTQWRKWVWAGATRMSWNMFSSPRISHMLWWNSSRRPPFLSSGTILATCRVSILPQSDLLV